MVLCKQIKSIELLLTNKHAQIQAHFQCYNKNNSQITFDLLYWHPFFCAGLCFSVCFLLPKVFNLAYIHILFHVILTHRLEMSTSNSGRYNVNDVHIKAFVCRSVVFCLLCVILWNFVYSESTFSRCLPFLFSHCIYPSILNASFDIIRKSVMQRLSYIFK